MLCRILLSHRTVDDDLGCSANPAVHACRDRMAAAAARLHPRCCGVEQETRSTCCMTAMTVFLLAPRAHATSRNSVFASPFSRLHITARRGELIGFEKVGDRTNMGWSAGFGRPVRILFSPYRKLEAVGFSCPVRENSHRQLIVSQAVYLGRPCLTFGSKGPVSTLFVTIDRNGFPRDTQRTRISEANV